MPDSNAIFEVTITNTGDVALDFDVVDGNDVFTIGPIAPGGAWTQTIERVPGDDCGPDVVISNTVTVTALYDGQIVGEKTATAECPVPCTGNEGCTPGFWKNHPACWCDSYEPDMLVSDVFTALTDPNYADIDDSKSNFDEDTLMDALRYKGGLAGRTRNLLRHATAALLNGCNDDVNFPIDDAVVIELVNAALETEDVDLIQELHSVLAEFNEYGCPINAHCYPEDDEDNGDMEP